ncbi:uncharacterized protein LOC119784756 isoform X1 [Cyprinodon tularosa]|uniref:uncharacterized protein LOC119784756 isoform X1 n=1 Tax=Cyprinodon tularosa TaxID=77115 RepID=UPI0018E1EF7B|nr:uncharacterized protein LOC119784756 isoform X1 [Cyprinodon tularosa]
MMDPYRVSTPFCFIIVYLLGATRLSSCANCSCPKIPPKNFTLPKDGCFNSGDTYRYQCIQGYTNKAGTSTRIKCEEQDGVLNWSKPSLVCIPKPGYKPQPTTSQANCSCPEIPPKNFTLPKDGCFNSGDAYRYQCIPGYTNKAGTSTRIKCEEQDGVLNWSKPSLVCIPKPGYKPQPTTSQEEPNFKPTPTSASETSTNQSVRGSTEASNCISRPETLRVAICLPLAVLFAVMTGIIILMYKRRNKPILSKDAEELEPMKC